VKSLSLVSLGLAVFNLGHRNSKENGVFINICCKNVCTACSKTNKKIILITSSKKYLYNYKSEIKVNINSSEKKLLKNTTIDELVTAASAQN
jgi:hypothetical protein